jgi:hypothetical protein
VTETQDPTAVDALSDASDEWQGERLSSYRLALDARGERQVWAGRIFVAALVLTLFTGILLGLPESWWVPAAGAVSALALVFRLVNWKCPNCGERLAARRPGSRCTGCGAPLD